MLNFNKLLIIITGSLLLLGGCQKIAEDKIPPVILLNGNNPATVLLGCNFTDPGAVVKDDQTSTPTLTVTGSVNPDSTGVYYLDYTAIDADSNVATARRKVLVQPIDFGRYAGSFNVADTLIAIPRLITAYTATITLFMSNPRRYSIANFNNFGNHFKVLFAPDSSGTFLVDYNLADTAISGSGYTFCDDSGFNISYIVTIGDTIRQHKATYKYGIH
jgi:hypothetical protein